MALVEWQPHAASIHDPCPAPELGKDARVSAVQVPARRERTQVISGRTCNYCGSPDHLQRNCTLGSSLRREHQFLRCSQHGGCFIRRFVCPLHRAKLDFRLDNLAEGRVDVAGRLMTAALMASQRVRHNSELWMPFLGDAPSPCQTVCVTGGLIRGLHPSETRNAARIRDAIDEQQRLADDHSHARGDNHGSSSAAAAAISTTAACDLPLHLRGITVLDGGFEVCLRRALERSRQGGTRAPLLLLEQGAPPIASVLSELSAAMTTATLQDLVIVLGDDIGLSPIEVECATRIGDEAGGGGAVIRASLGGGCLLASQCIVILHHYLDALHACPERLWEGGSEVRRNTRQKRRQHLRAANGYGKPPAYVRGYTTLQMLEREFERLEREAEVEEEEEETRETAREEEEGGGDNGG